MFLIRSNTNSLFSWLIRKKEGSKHSHYAMILSETIHPNALVIESSITKGGCKFTTLKTFCSKVRDWEITELDEPSTAAQIQDAIAIAQEYEGSPYDLEGAIGLGVDKNWQDPDKWWCTELVFILLKRIGMLHSYDWSRSHRYGTLDCQNIPQKVIQKGRR